MPLPSLDGARYAPTYFLAALGNGGLAVSFFIYLMFLLPHPDTPVPTFADVHRAIAHGPVWQRALTAVAAAGVALFAARHVRLLVWNLALYRQFRRTPAYRALRDGNGEVSLLAIPLTLAMAINVAFVAGALFVPNLWAVVEWLFPAAMAAFGLVAVQALKLFGEYASRILVTGQFDRSANTSLAQMTAIFAFAMIGVGFAAPAAMSHVPATATSGMILSIFFLTAAALVAMVKLVTAFQDMMTHGVSVEAAPTLWILIPIVTLVGIALLRIEHGMAHTLGGAPSAAGRLVLMTVLLSVQVAMGLLGWLIMRRIGYFRTYVDGPARSPMSYALICPGVALFVFGMFYVHVGLIQAGLVLRGDFLHMVLLAVLAAVQVRTIHTVLKLDRKLLWSDAPCLVAGPDAPLASEPPAGAAAGRERPPGGSGGA